jgi:AcrR family transcriptional regulator
VAKKVTPPPPQRRLKPAVRRERLLGAAASVFAERGYEAARIEQVADAAGVSPGLLYRHFAGKKELYAELVQRADGELVRHLAEAAAPGPPSHSRLEHGVDAVLAFIEQHPDLWQMLVRDVVDPDIKALREAAHAHAVAVVARQIEADPELERQDVTVEEVERMATLIVGSTTSLAQWWTDHPRTPRADVLRTLMGVLWLGFDRLGAGERYDVDLTRE